MQVDPTPKSSGDGGTVSSVGGVPSTASESMVGNPPQTLPPELRGDVPPGQQERTAAVGDCGASELPSKGGHANSCSEVPAQQQCNSETVLNPTCINTDVHDKAEVPKTGAVEGPVSFLAQQWPCGKKVSPEVPLNTGQNNVNPSQPSKSQAQSVISLPPGFHCSSLFKPGQPLAFLPAANFGSPLCKITLPPGLGQIAALREATANQFHVDAQSQSTSSGMTPSLHTYGYHISMGRPIAPETKSMPVAPKAKGGSTSSSKSSKGGAKHGSALGFVASPALALPLKQPSLSSAPLAPVSIPVAAPVCGSPTIASITVHTRPPNHLEKGQQSADKLSLAYARLESPTAIREPGAVCPSEVRDMPLDLSSKSKRQNAASDSQKTTKVQEPNPTEANLNDSGPPKRTPMAGFGSAPSYAIYPDALRNGAHQKQPSRLVNHQVLDPAASWAKLAPQGTIASLSGTYVGVASPILASTLRSKDGKCTAFVEDLQSIAKQESISIIDQGEQLTSRAKKGPHVTKEAQKAPVSKRPNNTCLPVTPSKDLLPQSFSSSPNLHSHSKVVGGKAVNPHNTAADVRHPPGLMPQRKASKQQKILQGSTKAHLPTSCHGSLHKGPSKAEEKKWDQTKCPLSNLESIVNQKALETTGLAQDSGGNLSNSGSRKPEVASLQTSQQDSQIRQIGTGGFPSFKSAKWRDGKIAKDCPIAVPHVHERGSETELGEHPSERHVRQDGNDGDDHLGGHAVGAAVDADKRGPGTAQATEGGEEKWVSSSPRVKMEGIALSVLKGHHVTTADQGKKTAGAKGKAAGNRPKKLGVSKTEASAKASKKVVESLKRPLDTDATVAKQGRLAKKVRVKYVVMSSFLTVDKTGDVSSRISHSDRLLINLVIHSQRLGRKAVSVSTLRRSVKDIFVYVVHPLGWHNSGHVDKTVAVFLIAADDQGAARRRSDPFCEAAQSPCVLQLRKPGTPGLEQCQVAPPPSQQERKQDGGRKGKAGALGVQQLPRAEAERSPVPYPKSAGKESGDSDPPRLRRGRRRSDRSQKSNWSPLEPSPPPPPQPAFRRPRGRPRSNPLPGQVDATPAVPQRRGSPAPSSEGEAAARKKRRRRKNRKYQNGEYITEREQVGEAEGEAEDKCVMTRQAARAGAGTVRRSLFLPRDIASVRAGLMGAWIESANPGVCRKATNVSFRYIYVY
uniref:BCL6 corepressor-like 1 n=1 Tax=Scleropages formosus TaxID=113540 RepID=A0A8C9VZK5_SCLFO